MTRYGVALGSNLGDRLGTLRSAIEAISQFASAMEVSPLYETAPVGGPEQGPYLNAAVSFDCDLSPIELLHQLQAVEDSHGRVRDERWGPRTLDLDIIVSELGPANESPELIVPHPRAHERRFVIEPMMTVWPGAELASGISLDDALAGVMDQEVRLLTRSWADGFGPMGRWLVGIQMLLFLVIGLLLATGGQLPGGVGLWQVLGTALLVAGIWIGWRSVVVLGRNLVAVPEPVADGKLITAGPYRWFRHPIYVSLVSSFAGVSLILEAWWALLGTAALYGLFAFKSRYEEGLLRATYPDFEAYAQNTRYRMPFLR